MRGIRASFLAECHDISNRPLAWVGALSVAFVAWIFGTHGPLTGNGYVVFEGALQPAARIASFFLLGIAAVSVAGQRSRGTVRFVLPRPISRVGFVLGKACALFLLALVFLVIGVGVSWWTAADHGFGDVVAEAEDEGFHFVEDEDVPVEFQAATMRRRTAAAALLVLPALLTATGIGLLVSCLLDSAAGAVILSIVLALPLQYLPETVGLSEKTARIFPFRAAADFLDQLTAFGRRLATAEWPEYGAGPVLGAAFAILALPLLGALLFARLDITD